MARRACAFSIFVSSYVTTYNLYFRIAVVGLTACVNETSLLVSLACSQTCVNENGNRLEIVSML